MRPHSSFCTAFLLATCVGLAHAWYPPVLMGKWGSHGSLPGQFSATTWLACDASGNVYVSDRGNSRIQVFDNTGGPITKWGSLGPGDGQLNTPMHIALGSGDVYVADLGNSRVQRFTTSGSFVTKWGSPGTGDGQFAEVGAIAIDAAGDIYVCDSNSRIQKFSNAGTFKLKWGSNGTAAGQFTVPTAIAVGPNGHVYVLDYRFEPHNPWSTEPPVSPIARIEEFTPTGMFIREWGSYGVADSQFVEPRGMAVDGAGRVYVDDNFMSRVCVFTADGVFLGRWGTFGTGGGQFYTPRGITVDASGHVFVSDAFACRIQKFGGGSPVAMFPVKGSSGWVTNGQSVHFDVHWSNPNLEQGSLPLSATLLAQPFGAFLPDGPAVATFDVPPMPPGGELDVSVDVPIDALPPSPPRELPAGGPGPSDACPPGGWAGNVEFVWSEGTDEARSNTFGGDLLVAPGKGQSFIRLIVDCQGPQPSPWRIAGVLPGFNVAVLEPDHVTLAPNLLPPGWQGWIGISAEASVPAGVTSCFDVLAGCDEAQARIRMCATTCDWTVSVGGPGAVARSRFGIAEVTPNPAAGAMRVRFALPEDAITRLVIYDAAGRRLRTLADGALPRGEHVQLWDGLGPRGERLRPGTYFVRLCAAGRVDSRAITRVR